MCVYSVLSLYVLLYLRSLDDDSLDINDNIEVDEVCIIVLCCQIGVIVLLLLGNIG